MSQKKPAFDNVESRLQAGSQCFQGSFWEPDQVGNTMFNMQGAMQGWECAWVDKSGAASESLSKEIEGLQYLQGSWYRQTQVLNVQSAGGNAGGVGVGLSGAGYGGRALPCPARASLSAVQASVGLSPESLSGLWVYLAFWP